MATAALSIPAPVIEPVLLDFASITLRIMRVPSTRVPDTTGGYAIYRATSRSGFMGALSSDYAFVAFAAQPVLPAVFVDKNLASEPATATLFYRVVAVNSITAATEQSPPSNVLVWQQLGDRRTPIPAWPVDLFPNQGVLKGIVPAFEDADADAGVTWFEARTAMAAAMEFITDELLQSITEGDLWNLLRSPPPALRGWFENLAARQLVERAGLQAEDLEKRREQFEKVAAKWRDELYDDSGTVIIPGGGTVATGGLRVVR